MHVHRNGIVAIHLSDGNLIFLPPFCTDADIFGHPAELFPQSRNSFHRKPFRRLHCQTANAPESGIARQSIQCGIEAGTSPGSTKNPSIS